MDIFVHILSSSDRLKHLFIINPMAAKVKGKEKLIIEDIRKFFESNQQLPYDIHVTRWARDASGFVRRYVVKSDDIVRIHTYGGSGTLYEVVNGAIGLPNVQIASYPYGDSNYFIRYFGTDKLHLFSSLRNQVFSGVTPVDAIRFGPGYGLSYCIVGIEAEAFRDGIGLIERTGLSSDIFHIWAAAKNLISKNKNGQHYQVSINGSPLDGNYFSMMLAGAPCYGKKMYPAVDAHPNDGRLEVYLTPANPKWRLISGFPAYLFGEYYKKADLVKHYSGSSITISSDSVMCIAVDGETFYEDTLQLDVIPYAIDFVCPSGIDVKKLPRIYNKPEEGCISDQKC